MNDEQILKLAESIGFEHMIVFDASILQPEPAVREMCAEDKCHRYGKSWSCPPYCGSLEELQKRFSGYSRGILVQTTKALEDDFDYETMMEAEEIQKKRFFRLAAAVKKQLPDCLPVSSGSCTLCESCSCPDAPCQHPEQCYPSMEACGLLVSQVCRDAGLEYYYGKQTVTYTACILY